MNKWKKAGILLSLLSVAEAGSSAYFYRRTMKRGMMSTESTTKMAGTDWSQYANLLKERKERLLARPRMDVSIRSKDGLRLRGTYIPNGDEKKIVICFHGYTSQGMSDYIGLSDYVDFSNATMEEAEKTMTAWTAVPFKPQDSPMNRIVMIKTPDGYEGIYFLADHRTMDAQSLICFLRDVIELYCSQKYEGVPAPKEMASYVEQLKKDLAYEMGSKAKERDEAYFQKLIDEMPEPIYNGIAGTDALEAERKKTGDPNARAAVNVSDSVDSAWIPFIWKQNLPSG